MLDLRFRLAETQHWCAPRASVADPAALRSLMLLPPEQQSAGRDRAARLVKLASISHRRALVDAVGAERSRLVHAAGWNARAQEEPSRKGHLLVCDPDFGVRDGASEFVTRGFFDGEDTPPWDTWLWYVNETGDDDLDPRAKSDYWQAYLVSWVPLELVDLVDKGIRANPVDCIAWAREIDTTFIRTLRSEQLL